MKQLTEVAEISVSYLPIKSAKPQIVTALDAFVELIDFYAPCLIGLQEQFLIMYLNRANRVLGVYCLLAQVSKSRGLKKSSITPFD